jgi:hypothetical protein
MNCHGNKNQKGGSHKHNPMKHMLHMILCCGLPILIIGLLPTIAKVSPAASKLLAVIAPFICPIMMVGMMFMMFKGDKTKSCCGNKDQVENNDLPLDRSIE